MRRSTVVVIAVFASLLGVAAVVLREKPERGITRLSLADVPKDRVDRIVFSGKNAAELKKEGAGWRLAGGREADAAAVGRLLDALVNVKSSDLVSSDAGRWAEYEVDDEKGTKLTTYAGGASVAELVIGKGLAGALVVRSGDAAFRVSGVSPGVFVRAPSAWIEHRLFSDKLEDVSRLEVKLTGAAPYALVRREGAWAVEDAKALPAGLRFDPEAARALVQSLVNLRAANFEDTDPGVAVTGLDATAETLAFVVSRAAPAPVEGTAESAAGAEADGGAKPAEGAAAAANPAGSSGVATGSGPVVPAPVVRVLRLGKTKGEQKDLFAKVDGRDDVFTLYEATAKSLKKTVPDLRDLRLMAFERDKARRLALTDGKVSLVLEKKNDAWELTRSAEPRPAGFELDPAAVERRLTALANARALRVTEPKERAATGFETPAARVSVTLEGGVTASLVFGRDLKDGDRELTFARGNIEAVPYLVTKWTRQSLTGGISSFGKQAAAEGGMPNLDPKALSSLPPEVRESLIRQMQQKQREQQLLKQIEQQAGKGSVTK